MYNWVGRFNLILVFIFAPIAHGFGEERIELSSWAEFAAAEQAQIEQDRRDGISHVISGSLALAGGIVGSSVSNDDIEKAMYTVFQSLGVASVGYGAYVWRVGGESRTIYQTLNTSRMSNEQRDLFLRAYALRKNEQRRRDRMIRAVTHGLIAGVNFLNATQQRDDSLKTSLFFIGAVNALASVSFTFEF